LQHSQANGALHGESMEDGIISMVMSGGDTDTNAAIAGALRGDRLRAKQCSTGNGWIEF
jgi:ADP-ribosylglycohydrolase